MMACEILEGRLPSTIVLMPGLFAGKWIWREQLHLLRSAAHRIICISDAFIKNQHKIGSIEELCATCERTVLRNAVGPILIIGNSVGGLVALMLARCLPDHVVGAIASGVPGLGREINLGLGTKDILSREFAHKVAKKMFFDQRRIIESEINHVFDDVGTPHSLLQAARILRSIRRFDVEEILHGLEQPILLIWGREDEITSPEPWNEAANRHCALNFHVIDRCGHCPMIEAAVEFDALAGPFIERVFSQAP